MITQVIYFHIFVCLTIYTTNMKNIDTRGRKVRVRFAPS